MWPLTQVHRANISPKLRVSFEQYGEAVVALILSRPLTHGPTTAGVPQWAESDADRQCGLEWLREKHDETARQHNVTMAMELAILVLVGVEAASTLQRWGQHLLSWIAQH